jgi:YHS domain-containing protein
MIRGLIYALIGIFLITFLRLVIGILFKGIGEMLQPAGPQAAANQGSAGVPTGGELKRDPVCGTFIPAATSLKKTVDGKVVHFCSDDCRNKYSA